MTRIFLIGLCLVQTATAQLSRTLDSLIAPNFQGNVPGMAVFVARQGQVLYKKAFGSADIELDVPLQPDMVFKIGSITKQFTAVGILRLVEQGRVRLSDSVQRYIPEFPHAMTVENLLTHTSGLIDYMSMNDPDPYADRREYKPIEIIHYFMKEPLTFATGTKYGYSNSNYTILGYIIQSVTGMPYRRYITDSVIKAAGLEHTRFARETDVVPGRVMGYSHDRGYYENADFLSMSLAYAAGDLLSTPEDLYRWNCALLAGKVLSPAMLQRAFTSYHLPDGSPTHYGYGWFVDSLQGLPCIHHEGQINGFIAEEKYFPTEDVYVSVMTNLRSGEDTTEFSSRRFYLMQDIALAAVGKLTAPAPAPAGVALDGFIGRYQSDVTPSLFITVYKEGGQLFANLSNKSGRHMLLVAETPTRFYLPDVVRIRTTFEFVKGGLIATQEKAYHFTKR